LAIEDKYEEELDKLIETGKEKGYLTYGEVNDLLPGDMHSSDVLDELMTPLGTLGLGVLESP
jgi:RNA polymerase primary sigma factor